MTTTNPSRPGEPRLTWVSFRDDPARTCAELQPEGEGSTPNSCPATPSTAGAGSLERSSWVQFEESPWIPSPPDPSQVKGPRHSVCSSPSFWSIAPTLESSWTPKLEEQSSLSDLHTDEPSLTHSNNSSIFQDDEGIDMDSLNWPLSDRHMSSQPETARFPSWVTFDEEDEGTSLGQSGGPSPFTTLVHLSQDSALDTNTSLTMSLGQSSHIERHLLDLMPDATDSTLAVENPLLRKKNPFLNEKLSNIPPSPINPFSAYFKQEARITLSNGPCPESSCSFPFSSPHLTNSDTTEPKQESLLLFTPTEVEDVFTGALGESLELLKGLQVTDPDRRVSSVVRDDLGDAEDLDEPPYQPAHMSAPEGWPMMLRIPEKKNIMSSRHWGPIFVKLTDSGQLQLFYERGLDKPFRELQLDCRHEPSDHRLQSYDESGPVHTISIDRVTYKEKRKMQSKTAMVPIREQAIKLGTVHYWDFRSFTHTLQEVLRRLPQEPDSPSGFLPSCAEEEVVVEVRDEFHGIVSKGEGRIRQQLVVTRIHMLAFVSGSPTCKLGVNDIRVKGHEAVPRSDIVPNSTSCWIRLYNCQVHSCVDEKGFADTGAITFNPPSGRRFELLRFRTPFTDRSLPFTLRTVASVRGAEVELQSWLVMSSGFLSNQDRLTLIPCENVMIRYPIPLLWAKNFRRESVVGEKSLKARFNKGASFGSASTSGSEPVMRVTLGSAKYEHAFKAVVWRINRLPDKNSGLEHPHTFFCRLELGSDWEVPPKFQRHLEVEFDMPASSASKATVRSLSVGETVNVKKWISYKSHYTYQVEIEQKTDCVPDGWQTDHPGECATQ